MKRCFSICFYIVCISQYVQSQDDRGPRSLNLSHTKGPPPSTKSPSQSPDYDKRHVPDNSTIIIAMGVMIGLLLIVIAGLLTYIYTLKRNYKCSSINDTLEITANDSTNRYVPQIHNENNDTPPLRENIPDKSMRFKISRQNSKLAIVDYPKVVNSVQENNDTETNTSTLNKKIHAPMDTHTQEPMQKEQIKILIENILTKQKPMDETTSLANLDEILNEDPELNSLAFATGKRGASTPLLDKSVSNENISSTSPTTKIEKMLNIQEKSNHDTSNKKKYLPFRLPPINKANKLNSIEREKSEENKQKKVTDENDLQVDEIYDDLPAQKRPVTLLNPSAVTEDIYDTIDGAIKPVEKKTENNEETDDIYDQMPSNKPITRTSAPEDMDDIYDNPTISNKPVLTNTPLSKSWNELNQPKEGEEKVETTYDLPMRRKVAVQDDTDSGYLLTLTSNDDLSFNSLYCNAKSFNQHISKDV